MPMQLTAAAPSRSSSGADLDPASRVESTCEYLANSANSVPPRVNLMWPAQVSSSRVRVLADDPTI